jgi:Ca2+-binding RTX toxin-like protein
VRGSVEGIGGGDGNDVLTGNASDNGISGGDGADVIDGGKGADFFLSGGDGEDVVRGGGGDDQAVLGGEGSDRLFGGGGDDSFESTMLTDDPDDYHGGKGIDLIDYTQASGAVRVTLDGRGNDGVEGENDNVRKDVEDVLGTPLNDVLIGSAHPNDLVGGDGNDRLVGKGSFDGLSGGRGNDRLSGGKNRDLLRGDAGRDRIGARDGGPDQVYCGSSVDLVLADRADRTAADCDRVKRTKRRR